MAKAATLGTKETQLRDLRAASNEAAERIAAKKKGKGTKKKPRPKGY